MGQIDSGSKSNRLLASRRYTHNTFNTAQESFTNVLDLRSEEIYTRAHLIPSSSLPHSGSSQKGSVFTKNGQNVTKYWYRHKLTKSNTNNEVWFFLNPTGSDDGVGAQLINDNQQTSFISPKYSTSALANATTEDATPGYLALVYKSTTTNTSSLDGDDIVSTNDYQFDYKTGVLQFRSSTVDPTDSQYLYMSVYQYVGQNLRTGLEIEGPFTASNMSFGGDVTGSSTSTGSFGQVFVGDRLVFKDHQDSGEYIESDGTDLSINVGANGDINIPANIGMTFGNDGEKIEGDGTDLTISGNNINLTAVADVNIPSGVGLTFATGEKLESDGTDLSITVGSGGDINIPADIGITLGDDGEKIEGDGTDLTVASSNDLNLTATTDINIPANVGLTFGDDGEKIEGDGTDMTIASSGALTLSSGGDTTVETVTFNNGNVTIPGDLTVTGDRIEAQVGSLQVSDHTITVGSGSDSSALMQNGGIDWGISGSVAFLRYRHAGTALSSSAFLEAPKLTVDTITIDAAEIDATGALDIDTGGDLTLSATGDVNIPANIGLTFGNDGEKIEGDGTDLTISGNKIKLDSTMVTGSSTTTGSFAHGYFASKIGINETAPAEALEVIGNVSGSGTGSFHHTLTRQRAYLFDAGGEYLLGDGTDLTIASGQDLNLTATTDINIPSGVGLTFGNDGEKIEGDGTDLTIASSAKLKLDVATDLEIDVDGGDIKITDDGAHIFDISATKISGSATSTGSFGHIKVPDDGRISIGDSNDLQIYHNGSHSIIRDRGTGNLILRTNVFQVKNSDDTETMLQANADGNVSLRHNNNQKFATTADGVSVTGNVEVTGNISGSSTSTGSFARIVADNGAFIVDNAKVSGSSVTTGSFGRLELAGNANIDGNITLGGSINIGDAAGDDIVLGGEIKSNIIPDADATYDLGSSSKGWNDLHLGSGGVINLDGGDVTLTHSSNLVTITGGTTRVDKLEIDGANDHIDVDTDMVLTAAADITLTPGGANVKPGSDSAIDLGVSGTAFRELFVDAIDLNGQGSISVGGTGRIDLDADDDTSIRASADDIITFEAGAVDIAQMTSTMAISGSSVSTGSFGRVEATTLKGDGSDLTNVTDDGALAFSIVFGG